MVFFFGNFQLSIIFVLRRNKSNKLQGNTKKNRHLKSDGAHQKTIREHIHDLALVGFSNVRYKMFKVIKKYNSDRIEEIRRRIKRDRTVGREITESL